MKEATARIKINKLLESAGWRFFADGNAPANIQLEPSITIESIDLDAPQTTLTRVWGEAESAPAEVPVMEQAAEPDLSLVESETGP